MVNNLKKTMLATAAGVAALVAAVVVVAGALAEVVSAFAMP